MVKSCIHDKPEHGYKNAKKILNEFYGDPHRVFSTYRKELKSLSGVKSGDGDSFRRFYGYLLKYKSFMKSLEYFKVLDSLYFFQILQSKLPNHLKESWNRLAMKKIQLKHFGWI